MAEAKIDFDFDSMDDDELKGVGSGKSKFKPVAKKTDTAVKSAEKPAEKSGEGIFDFMFKEGGTERPKESVASKPAPEKPKASTSAAKPAPEKPKAPTSAAKPAPEKPKAAAPAAKPKTDMSLDEIGTKIDELMSEDADLRSTYATMPKDKKATIVRRLNEIVVNYNNYVKMIDEKVSKMVSSKDISTMTEEEVLKEIAHLTNVNGELRDIYAKTSNAEVKVAIEGVLAKLNSRHSDLVDAYNAKTR